ncbi:30S ribosomal protein S1 [Geomonas sp. Red69]|uniref:30S ribosomal protein S1 n=1 Tax=Geomonas diazotrophica TaxID=2843197 RepID=UPI001C113E20|nr:MULTISPECIES: 30S ribosomal protein S1 [Geomonas]MBU5638804.1 30S ribosomal protein S1 [Geomonas diazotrophica]QXE85702.1 30S ribosomal protein S1 [Geomonas nitrogeniifigens]
MDNDHREEMETEEESFADLFERSQKDAGRLEPGAKVEATVLQIAKDWIFLDTGRKGEGVLDIKELLDADGNLSVKVGDKVTAWFVSSRNNEMRFTTKLGGGGSHSAGNAQLEEAYAAGIPVQGVVEKEVKGGFEVKVAGSRAFCPFSQIALRRVEDTAALLGKQMSFKITEYSEKGRNIVLSHRALLEEELQQQKDALKETLNVGDRVKGTVTSLRDFGAFVSIGAVEGLLPVSEVAWARVNHVSEVLSVGQEVEVVVKGIDWEKNRISFSLKDTLADPWEEAASAFPEGSYQNGKVARLTPFGAFVTLASGVDGLIHISKLGAGKRIQHPKEVLSEGQEVEVKVESVDREAKKISLALASVSRAAEEQAQSMDAYKKTVAEAPKGMGTLGDLLKAKLKG